MQGRRLLHQRTHRERTYNKHKHTLSLCVHAYLCPAGGGIAELQSPQSLRSPTTPLGSLGGRGRQHVVVGVVAALGRRIPAVRGVCFLLGVCVCQEEEIVARRPLTTIQSEFAPFRPSL